MATSKTKSSKDAPAAAVVLPDLSVQQQVEELAQALLREYLHRSGCKETLALFDNESPRTVTTISSRAVMSGLMFVDALQARNKQRAKPFATFMELLCSYRLRKRRIRLNVASGAVRGPADNDSSDDEDGNAKQRASLQQRVEAARERVRNLEARIAAAAESSSAGPASTASKADVDDGKPAKKSKKKHLLHEGAGAENGTDVTGASDVDVPKKKKKSAEEKAASKAKKAAATATKFDPLGLSAGGRVEAAAADEVVASDSLLLLTGRRSTTAGATQVGHSWNPLGTAQVPAIGLGGGGSVSISAPDPTAAWRPNFVAGDGFQLTTNRVRAEVVPLDAAINDSPTRQVRGGGHQRRPTASRDSPNGSESQSPYVPKNTYDPTASAAGVLATSSHSDEFSKEPAGGVKKERKRVVIMADP